MEGLIAFILFLIALYLGYLLVVWIFELIIEILSTVWDYFSQPTVYVPLLLFIGVVYGLVYYTAKKRIQEEEEQERKDAEYRREQNEIRRVREAKREEERKRKEAENRRKNAERKRKEDAARKERERKEAIAKKKAQSVKAVIDQCRKDGMPSELTTFLSSILSNVTNPSHRDVLVNIWQPLGKPLSGGLEAHQSWMLTQVSGLTNLKSIKSELNKLNKQIVKPMNKDLSHLVATATSSGRYDLLVSLWKKYDDMSHSNEVIERIYNGENEDFVLADLDLLQS
jgi:ABC-type multidrug transport system fused ATPase/permease subunit